MNRKVNLLRRFRLLLLLTCCATSCNTTPNPSAPKPLAGGNSYEYSGNFAGVSYVLIDQAASDLQLAEGHTWEVDRKSELLLRLKPSHTSLTPTLARQWRNYSDAIDALRNTLPGHIARVRELAKRLNAGDEGALEESRILNQSQESATLLSAMSALSPSSYEALRDGLLSISQDDSITKQQRLEALDSFMLKWTAEAASTRFDELLAASRKESDRYRVSVQAFVHNNDGRKALAIPDYNKIGTEEVQEIRPIASSIDTKPASAAALALADLSDAIGSSQPGGASVRNNGERLMAKAASRALEGSAQLKSPSEIVDARIDLLRSGISAGQAVTIHLTFFEKTEPSSDPAGSGEVTSYEQRKRVTWKVRVVNAHWNRNLYPAAVFLRGDSSTEGNSAHKNWNINAAAIINWSYYHPNATGGWSQLYNWLGPGFGLHLAAPTMEEQNGIEFGVGLNVSLWEGFLNAGWGYNLSSDERGEYYFIGIDLFETLNKAKGVADKARGE